MADDTIPSRVWKIYRITCGMNGKIYIGMTVRRVKQRWSDHVSEANRKGTRMILHRAIRKHGRSAFTVDVLHTAHSLEEASHLEQVEIRAHASLGPAGYNSAHGGMGTPGFRKRHSEETKKKIGEGNRGRTYSTETRRLMSIAKKGKPLSAEHCKNLGKAQTGRVKSASECANIAAAHLGNKYPRRSIALLKGILAGGAPNTSGYRGVIPEGRRWTARLGINGKRVHLGVFDTCELASAAYIKVVQERIAELQRILDGDESKPFVPIAATIPSTLPSINTTTRRSETAKEIWRKRRAHPEYVPAKGPDLMRKNTRERERYARRKQINYPTQGTLL